MEWWLVLIIIGGMLMVLMATGMPVAFSFVATNVLAVFLFWGGQAGLLQLSRSIIDSLVQFALVPIPLFILMGEVLFQTGIASRVIDVVDKWLGRVPGRLSLLAVAGTTMFGAVSGSTVGASALFGELLVPEMEKRGYSTLMSLGPILGGVGLVSIIPPSTLAILLGGLGYIPIGELLIAGIIPGVLIACLFAVYIFMKCKLQPYLAPPYEVSHISLSRKLVDTARYLLPLGLIIFMVLGFIILGITSPSEAAATGALGSFILAAIYRKLNWNIVKKCLTNTLVVTTMVFMVCSGSKAFSQVLAFSGAVRGLIEVAVSLPIAPIFLGIIMLILVLVMGCFMDVICILMITVPIFIPLADVVGFDLIWFGILMLLCLTLGGITPPFGIVLFILKGVTPSTSIADIARAAVPFFILSLVGTSLVIIFPELALWLPSFMR